MASLFALLTLACLIFFIIGLISPKLALFFYHEEKRTRGKVTLIYLLGFFLSGFLCAMFSPPKELTVEEKQTLEQQKKEAEVKEAEKEKNKIAEKLEQKNKEFNKKYNDFILGDYDANAHYPNFVEDFIEVNPDLNKEDKEKFRKCLSEFAYTKDKKIKAIDAIGWCKNERLNNITVFNEHIDLDKLFTKFSPWDGSFRPLEKAIKAAMNDPKSYEHFKTYYKLNLSDRKNPKAIITEEFRGKNAFGAIIKQTVQIEYDINSETFEEIR